MAGSALQEVSTTTPGGRLVFHVFAAPARGQRLGRPPAMSDEQIRQARALLTGPDESVFSIARLPGVSRTTLYKYVPELSDGTRATLKA
ncbi:helix-turn-helix domain-containing protein [Nocardia sp. NPDC058499]|uniref:helix-turn-helix domain-containing protein n=1 Tax=Nocardia sp. NPDC058499 TaxID=3346530 RepID=UPI0036586B8C